MKPQTFYARIFGQTEEEFQDVFVYPLYEDGQVVDCEIKIPLMVQPSGIRDDVSAWLRDYNPDAILGNLLFSIVPQDKYIAP